MGAQAVIKEKTVESRGRSRTSSGGRGGKNLGVGVSGESTARAGSQEDVLRNLASRIQGDDPMRAAVLKRAMRAVVHALAEADSTSIEKILDAPTDVGSVARLLATVIENERAVHTLDPTAAAILRGAKMKQELLDRAGGAFDASQVAGLLGVSKAAVVKRVHSGTLLAITDPSGHLRFPVAQFTDVGALSGLKEVLAAFNVESPWTRLAVLLDTDDAVGGKRIIDALRDGELQRVLDVVRSFGA